MRLVLFILWEFYPQKALLEAREDVLSLVHVFGRLIDGFDDIYPVARVQVIFQLLGIDKEPSGFLIVNQLYGVSQCLDESPCHWIPPGYTRALHFLRSLLRLPSRPSFFESPLGKVHTWLSLFDYEQSCQV